MNELKWKSLPCCTHAGHSLNLLYSHTSPDYSTWRWGWAHRRLSTCAEVTQEAAIMSTQHTDIKGTRTKKGTGGLTHESGAAREEKACVMIEVDNLCYNIQAWMKGFLLHPARGVVCDISAELWFVLVIPKSWMTTMKNENISSRGWTDDEALIFDKAPPE